MRIFLITSLLFTTLQASAAKWHMLAGSEFNFESTFEETVLPGSFEKFNVVLVFDPDNPGDDQLQVMVDLEAATMGDPDIDAAIAGPEWFHLEDSPLANFTSKEIVVLAPGRYVAKGELDLKGIRKKVDVPFTWSVSGNVAEMAGELTLQRTDFNIGSGEWSDGKAIGLSVRLIFTVHLGRND